MFEQANRCVVSSTYPRRIFGNRIQNRLDLRWRARDDTQNLARRRLLFQRLFEFLKQPDVFKGDHRLVGESFKQLDLRRSKRAHVGATCVQRSDEISLLKKRHVTEKA